MRVEVSNAGARPTTRDDRLVGGADYRSAPKMYADAYSRYDVEGAGARAYEDLYAKCDREEYFLRPLMSYTDAPRYRDVEPLRRPKPHRPEPRYLMTSEASKAMHRWGVHFSGARDEDAEEFLRRIEEMSS